MNAAAKLGGVIILSALAAGAAHKSTSKPESKAKPVVHTAAPASSVDSHEIESLLAEIRQLKAELKAAKANALGWYKQSPQYKERQRKSPVAELKYNQPAQGDCANGQCSPYSSGRRGLFGGFR